jgi:hypothetical protein
MRKRLAWLVLSIVLNVSAIYILGDPPLMRWAIGFVLASLSYQSFEKAVGDLFMVQPRVKGSLNGGH